MRSGGVSAEKGEPPDGSGSPGLCIGASGVTGWKSGEAGLSAGLLLLSGATWSTRRFSIKLGLGTSRAAGWAL